MPSSVVIRHPLSHLLMEVASTWNDTLRGQWGTVATWLCADRLAATEPVQRELDAIGAQFAVPSDRLELLTDEVEEGALRLHGSRALTASALDLYSRVLCGQWNEMRWHCAVRLDPIPVPPVDLNVLRVEHSRPYEDEGPWDQRSFPPHPHASIGIAESTLPAKLAYHAYKALGAGAPGEPTFSLPEGPLTVEVVS